MKFSFEISRTKKSAVTERILGNTSRWFGFGSIGRSQDITKIKEEAYFNPYAYMVINRIAKSVARLPYSVMIGDKEKKDGYIYKLLSRPNSQQYTTEFLESLTTELMMCGECIIVARKAVGFGQPQALEVLKSQYVTLYCVKGVVTRYDYNYNGTIETINPEDILHIRFHNPLYNDDRALRGFSPLHALELVVKASNSNFNAEASILENRGVSGFISGASENLPIGNKDKEVLQQQFNKRHSGSDKFGEIAIVQTPTQYTQVGANSTDLQLLASNVSKLRVICALYGLSSQIFGDTESSIYSNMKEAKIGAFTECYIPTAEFIYDQLNKFIEDTLNQKEKIVLKKSEIDAIKQVNKDLSDKIVNEVKAGILSQEQAFNQLYPELQFDINAKPQLTSNQNGQAN